ncbi:MAG TPA: tRNA (adenosine(37)-N6)-threonylcarbamoyltransferase complex dimerization subunit type 1 TsaB [Candidatus Macondimonas sp.]|nr:tRNA (adenosine(37)-N6)-threonylcarbamoyltransferase complex dimerization subunit type 1 TsaB [Candidatus Macondimonas sp.]
MRLLAIDGATERASVALWSDGDLLYRERHASTGHGEWLLQAVRETVSTSGYALSSLDAVAFGCGPGSFTGLRVVAALVQGLAFGSGLGVIPVSDLEILAESERLRGDGDIVAALDARMGEVYWAVFRAASSRLERITEDVVGAPDRMIPPEPISTARGVGNAWAAYGDVCTSTGLVPPAVIELPSARHLVRLAVQTCAAGGGLLPPEAAVPVYIRDRVAHMPRP